MNTKSYKKFFSERLERGDYPKEVYDIVMRELEKDGKMTRRVYNVFLAELERRRLFGAEGTPFDTTNSAKTDGSFRYTSKNPLWKLFEAFWHGVYKFIGYVGAAIVFGVWRVKDRKKLKGLKSYITVSNHVSYLDCVLVRRALGSKKLYVVAAPHNCKNDFGGMLLHAGGAVPLPASHRGMKAFGDELLRLRDKGACIHLYAEQSMWVGYEKPRPYKSGAFYYADMLDMPIAVELICFKKSRGLRKLLHLPKAEVRIEGPLYPDKTLPKMERQRDLKARAEAAAVAMYEDFYGQKLEYLPEPNGTDSE